MKLRSARVTGFKSFHDSGEVTFADGINLVIGQNNSGKSALLEALNAALPNKRHRSPEKWEAFRLPAPQTHLTVEISGHEMETAILSSGGTLYVPIPHGRDPSP